MEVKLDSFEAGELLRQYTNAKVDSALSERRVTTYLGENETLRQENRALKAESERMAATVVLLTADRDRAVAQTLQRVNDPVMARALVELIRCIRTGNTKRIAAIKAVREIGPYGLKEAKDIVDEGYPYDPNQQ
jgi:hypothetical protein